jgi:hypothetical protein
MIKAAFSFLLLLCAVLPASADVRVDRVEKVGREIVRAFNERDEKGFLAVVDMDVLGQRVAQGMQLSPTDQKSFLEGFRRGGARNLVLTLFKALDSTQGTVRFLRVVPPSKVLVRFDLGGQGYDYYEFIVQPDVYGGLRAVDWFQLSRGALVSQAVGALAQLMIAPSPDLLRSLFGLKTVDKAIIDQMQGISAKQREGRYAEALAEIERLPDPIANSRVMLQTRVGTASMAKLDDAYRSALGQLAQRYGDDPSAAFLLLDHYFFERQTDKILEAVTTIEKRVGVDGVTRLFRANASMMAGRYDEAVKFAQESIRLEPDLLDSYYSLAEGYLGQKRYPEAVATLSGAGAKFGLVFDRAEFAKDPRYAELMKSAAFRKWLPK